MDKATAERYIAIIQHIDELQSEAGVLAEQAGQWRYVNDDCDLWSLSGGDEDFMVWALTNGKQLWEPDKDMHHQRMFQGYLDRFNELFEEHTPDIEEA
jgi:hypothetical protein